jgi:hypothetical protein
MCGAGRKVVCPDMMSMTTWHTPCTRLGTAAWSISQGHESRVMLLCSAHDADLRAGRAPWIIDAVPLGGRADS